MCPMFFLAKNMAFQDRRQELLLSGLNKIRRFIYLIIYYVGSSRKESMFSKTHIFRADRPIKCSTVLLC